MKRSTDRFLTTHTGSLPRPEDLIRTMFARDAQAVANDVAHLRGALAKTPAPDAFLTAASPGVVSLFFRNEHYPDEETYLYAIADAMRHEYKTIVDAGITLQVDCPDLA